MIILGVLVGALLLLGGVCGGWYLLHNSGNNTAGAGGTPSGRQATTGQPSPALTGPMVDARCDIASNHPKFKDTKDFLEKEGLKVNREDVPGPKDRVVEVTPCQAPKGATITVRVGNGKAGGATPGTSPTGDNSGPGGGLPGPGCSLGIGGGIGCPSNGPNPSGAG
jgi:hypothetical protein